MSTGSLWIPEAQIRLLANSTVVNVVGGINALSITLQDIHGHRTRLNIEDGKKPVISGVEYWREYQLHEDPGHGWLQVPFEDLEYFEFERTDFSSYSYLDHRDETMYLEEDADAAIFLYRLRAVAKEKGWQEPYQINTTYYTDSLDLHEYPDISKNESGWRGLSAEISRRMFNDTNNILGDIRMMIEHQEKGDPSNSAGVSPETQDRMLGSQ